MKNIRPEGFLQTKVAPGCYDLATHDQIRVNNGEVTKQIVSAWQMSDEEFEEFNRNGRIIYVALLGSQPPIEVGVTIPKEDYTGERFTMQAIAERLHAEWTTSKVRATDDGVLVIFSDCHFKLDEISFEEMTKAFNEILENEQRV